MSHKPHYKAFCCLRDVVLIFKAVTFCYVLDYRFGTREVCSNSKGCPVLGRVFCSVVFFVLCGSIFERNRILFLANYKLLWGIKMRKNFAEVLKTNKINIRLEYDKLYSILYSRNIWLSNGQLISLHDLINSNFMAVTFRKTCLSLDEFDEVNGFRFVQFPQDVDLEMLVNISEYIWNMLQSIRSQIICNYPPLINIYFYYQQIQAVIDSIGYSIQNQNGYVIFVPKDNVAISVSESTIIPETVSYKVIEYNHHSIKGILRQRKAFC